MERGVPAQDRRHERSPGSEAGERGHRPGGEVVLDPIERVGEQPEAEAPRRLRPIVRGPLREEQLDLLGPRLIRVEGEEREHRAARVR